MSLFDLFRSKKAIGSTEDESLIEGKSERQRCFLDAKLLALSGKYEEAIELINSNDYGRDGNVKTLHLLSLTEYKKEFKCERERKIIAEHKKLSRWHQMAIADVFCENFETAIWRISSVETNYPESSAAKEQYLIHIHNAISQKRKTGAYSQYKALKYC